MFSHQHADGVHTFFFTHGDLTVSRPVENIEKELELIKRLKSNDNLVLDLGTPHEIYSYAHLYSPHLTIAHSGRPLYTNLVKIREWIDYMEKVLFESRRLV
jgi:hypothetical protein